MMLDANNSKITYCLEFLMTLKRKENLTGLHTYNKESNLINC